MEPNAGSAVRISASRLQVSQRSGPLPPPEDVQAYEKIIPDFGERVMSAYESTVRHEQAMEERQMTVFEKNNATGRLVTVLGVSFAAVFFAMIIGLGGWLISKGRYETGVGMVALAGLAGLFIWWKGRESPKDDEAAKPD